MTVELEETLKKRLDETNRRKEEQLTKIKQIQSDIQIILKKMPKRPRESLQELDDKMKALERKRTVTSISLAEERKILKEIASVKKTTVQVEEYNTMDNQVQELKKKLSNLRDELSETITGSDEIQAALSKVKLANKLDCETQELTKKEISCPKARIGMVIGKNGAMVSKIQDSCKVFMVIDKVTDRITITGSEASIQAAIEEIEKIIRVEEVEIELKKTALNFFTCKYVSVIQQLRDDYPDAFVDVTRGERKLLIRGEPDQVAEIKAKVSGIQIISKERLLAGREAAILLGTKGTTIDKLCSDHAVSIEVDKGDEEHATATVTGPPSRVEAAMMDIEELMNDNREVTDHIDMTVIVKNILLAEGGRHIKALQTKVTEGLSDGNCFISVNKDQTLKDHPELLVRTKQSMMSRTLELVRDGLKEIEELFVKVKVDPYVIPKIIGKGGETIKKLTEGNHAFVEVDKTSGEICYGATTPEGRDEVGKDVMELVESNFVLRLRVDPETLNSQYREFNRSSVKNELNGSVWVDTDEGDSCFILRGKKENVEKAKELIETFIANNQIGEVPITEEDREALVIGGKTSKAVQFAEEMGVQVHIDRVKLVVVVRGPQDKVDMAVKRLNQYLNGGDGHSVAKIPVTEQVVGVVIGKGGKTRQELEKKYEGISINISKAQVVTIRGPDQSVADCRIEIGKMVASARVTQTISVSDAEKESLEKKDFFKKIIQQTPVGLSITGDKVIVKGSFYDVRDAVSLLNELLTGEYKTSIELDAPQFAKVRNAARDPSHFERMETATGAKVELDLASGSIAISGKRSNVKRAKDQVFGFLDFILPGEIGKLKITKPLYLSVGQAASLAEISAESGGVTVYLDRDLSLIVLRSTDKNKVLEGTKIMEQKIKDAERLAFVLEVSASDSWILPVIIGKNGNQISALRSNHSGCKIDVSKEDRTITVVGDSEETVNKVREAVLAAVEQVRSENVFFFIPETCVPQFVGKGGAHVKELSTTHGVDIQRVKKGQFNFKIIGEASKVEAARQSINDWLFKKEKANATLSFTLEKDQDIAVILGQKGGVARSLQDDYNCKIDIDRKTLVVLVKGENEENREAVVMKMKELVAKDREDAAARQAAAKEQKEKAALEALKDHKDDDSAKAASQTLSKTNSEGDSKPSEDDNKTRAGQFPAQPVGLVSSKNAGGKRKKNKVDASVNEGTEAGRNLFAMLVADD